MSRTAIISVIIVLLFPSFSEARIITVRQNGTGDFISIGDALFYAKSGDTVVVGDGIWTGDDNTDRYIYYGNISIKSENGPENCVIDCRHYSRFLYVELFNKYSFSLSGFTIKNCSSGNGGAIYVKEASASITDCIFIDNDADEHGGAIYCTNSEVTVGGCTFIDNFAVYGAALSIGEGVSVIDCKFIDNTASYNGGAIYISWYNRDNVAASSISGCSFDNNFAYYRGGAVYSLANELTIKKSSFDSNYSQFGGGVYLTEYGSIAISDSFFSENFADKGGALRIDACSRLDIRNTVFDHNAAFMQGGVFHIGNCDSLNISNCLFDHNTGLDYGGVIHGSDSDAAGPGLITNCTFVGNYSGSDDLGSIDTRYSQAVYYRNCIFHSNSYPLFNSGSLYSNMSYCCLQSNGDSHVLSWIDPNHNFFSDPLFVCGPLGDYYLSSTLSGQSASSLCIDAGSDPAGSVGLGNMTTRTDEVPDELTVDLGFHYPSELADLNHDGFVNMLDLSILSESYALDNGIVPETQKLAFWSLDEGHGGDYIYDSSGNIITASMHNIDPALSWCQGVSGTAINFDGVDDYIEVPYFLDPADGPFSLSVWVLGDSVGTIFQQLDGTGVGRKWLIIDSVTGTVGSCLADDYYGTLTGDYHFSADRWHNLAVVWDGKRRYIYADARLIAQDTTDLENGLEPSDGGYYIGCGKAGPPYGIFSGTVDEIRVYAAAVTEQEISNIFAEGRFREKGYWRFEEGSGYIAACSGDSTLVGTLNNMSESSWISDGRFGGGLSFDGIDDYVSVPFVLDPSSGPFSAFAWVKTPSTGTMTNRRIISQAMAEGTPRAWLSKNADGYLSTLIRSEYNENALESSFQLADDNWHHVGVVIDGLTRTLYADGSVVAQDQLGGDALSCSGGMLIGTYYGLSDKFWLGLIDDVRIYDFALSSIQVRRILRGGTAMVLESFCQSAPAADIDGDCAVDINDLILLASRWLK